MELTPALPPHGGDLAGAEARWGRPAAGWLDLSTGINPWAYPLPDLPAEAWTRLPGTVEEAALFAAARAAWGVPAECGLVAGAGSGALIQALPRLLPPGPVAIVSPTYGEHARAWAAAGHAVQAVSDPAQATAAVLVVVNPNNPDGRTHDPAALAALAARAAARGGLLVVDEAFGEVRPDLSLIPTLPDGAVVLRSFGKFYGLAGLRLGLAVARPALADRLAAQLGPWAVSGPALRVGAAALADPAWAAATRRRITAEADRLGQVLQGSGLAVLGGAGLFTLVAAPDGPGLYERLGRAGILVRAFAEAPGRLRFGLPADESGVARLARALDPR